MSAAASYLEALDASLVGPGRVRRDLVREAGDHLEDATDAYERAGYVRREAEQQAVADFGTLDQVAPGFQTTLAVALARRTALILVAALAPQAFLWDGGLGLAADSHAMAPSHNAFYAALDGFIEIGGAVGLLGAIATLVLTAVGQRWFRIGRRSARIAAWYALVSAVAVPLTGFTMLAMSGGLTPQLVALTLLLMVAPLGWVALSARRTLAAC